MMKVQQLNLPKKKDSDCAEPGMIEQSEWREGLPDPSYERIYTVVHNVIIHHSAGSNTDTNYTGIVRSIYIYHTEIRGWSDIGYNYLVAQDGVIFKGRDPGNLEQDDVLGAHFCASNSGTLGICVMGTYTEISPTHEAVSSLLSLVNWKLGKDSLDPVGTCPHALNAMLPVIAGHRDGCATECPGEKLYHKLDSMRYAVQEIYRACGYAAKPVVSGMKRNTSSGITVSFDAEAITIKLREGRISRFQLFDMMGHEVHLLHHQVSPDEILLFRDGLNPGIYIVSIMHNGILHKDKIVLF